MKCYQFNYHISYGAGQGIIFAKNLEKAQQLLKSEQICEKVELTEINMRETQLIDFSWQE